jgi:hypothetical protein
MSWSSCGSRAKTTTREDARLAVRGRVSPGRRRALKLQGRYLDMRQLKPARKAKVKAVKAKKGMGVAIAMARRMAKG